jgi:hypothetical protein
LNFSINGVSVGNTSTISVPNPTSIREISIFLMQDGSPASSKYKAASVTSDWFPNWNATIEIIKNGEILDSFTTTTPISSFTLNDSTSITGATYGRESCVFHNENYYLNPYSDNPIENPDTLQTNGIDFYLVRVVGENGRHTYIGPIWVAIQ